MTKIRMSFVTNSSSSSFIICFARIADKEKAQKIIDKYDLNVFDRNGVNGEKNWCGELGADYAGAIIWNVDDILEAHPDDEFIIIEDSNEAYYDYDDDDYGELIYNYNFAMNDAIDEITEENGFADIEIAEGEGRDG